MRYLFFLVHPSKYHLFRIIINKLIASGNQVDLVIISKGGLEELVKREKWNYINIFPKGRRIKRVNIFVSSIIYGLMTIYKLIVYTGKFKYDLLITDDLLTIAGRIRKIPSIFCTDDDISAVPESAVLAKTANYVLSPSITYMGRYEWKKIGYYGYKSLAHLHPLQFTPDRQMVEKKVKTGDDYFFIRCVSVTSTHDVGKKGISNSLLTKIVNHLTKYGTVIISSERSLPAELEKYRIEFINESVAHYLAFAKLFISDSTTMCAEAAILGTPSIEINDWFGDFRQYYDLSGKYGLLSGFKPFEEERIFNAIDQLLNKRDLKAVTEKNREKLLTESIDVSSFIYWIISEFPSSVEKYFKDKDVQLRFK